jgi:hypothetical protein
VAMGFVSVRCGLLGYAHGYDVRLFGMNVDRFSGYLMKCVVVVRSDVFRFPRLSD